MSNLYNVNKKRQVIHVEKKMIIDVIKKKAIKCDHNF